MGFVTGLMFGAAVCVPLGALIGAWTAAKTWRRNRLPSGIARRA
jgi:hypothetical protein